VRPSGNIFRNENRSPFPGCAGLEPVEGPADQAVVSRARYVECQTNEGFDLQKLKVLETYPETIDVAGKATPSTAVSLRTTASDGTTTATMHAVLLNGKWRWILSAADYAAYKQGKCPKG